MKKLMIMIAACVAMVVAGCSVTKVEYDKNDKGEVSYRLYRNSHWLKMEGEGMRGGMSNEGKFEFDLEGMKSSPSEEFNRTMQTYTTAFVQLAQIAAAVYNPSASAAIQSATTKQGGTAAQAEVTEATERTAATTNSAVCVGGLCTDVNPAPTNSAVCVDGQCTDVNPAPTNAIETVAK